MIMHRICNFYYLLHQMLQVSVFDLITYILFLHSLFPIIKLRRLSVLMTNRYHVSYTHVVVYGTKHTHMVVYGTNTHDSITQL